MAKKSWIDPHTGAAGDLNPPSSNFGKDALPDYTIESFTRILIPRTQLNGKSKDYSLETLWNNSK